ncbi:hypothetical protein [Staphylococcus pettenkoferi]|uniref:hypothetical protein n=1 Tax=Staphylococcus pettenkoferi TaxID=170573 RepID=UPI002DD44061|nr:hypothetical protein [Staphylococcus pettenkoferi]
MRLVLVLNLGSTTSKFALYQERECVVNETIAHELAVTQLPLTEQAPKRQATIERRVQKLVITLKMLMQSRVVED